jgi:hypothetical protein
MTSIAAGSLQRSSILRSDRDRGSFPARGRSVYAAAGAVRLFGLAPVETQKRPVFSTTLVTTHHPRIAVLVALALTLGGPSVAQARRCDSGSSLKPPNRRPAKAWSRGSTRRRASC